MGFPSKAAEKKYMKEYYAKRREVKLNKQKSYYQNNKLKVKDLQLRIKYGISLKDLLALRKKQNYLCKICRKKTDLKVDHCHKTGKIRGLLCGFCNVALGYMYDDVKLLGRAIKYLRANN